MTIYIASSWKNQHAVEMLTAALREKGHTVLSFVEKNFGEAIVKDPNATNYKTGQGKSFEEWCWSEYGQMEFNFDTQGATLSDLVIYLGPSGNDASAEMGAAWAKGVPIFGLWAKCEQLGLMRRMVSQWFENYKDLLAGVDILQKPIK
jgi:hypothetical protein